MRHSATALGWSANVEGTKVKNRARYMAVPTQTDQTSVQQQAYGRKYSNTKIILIK